MAGRPSTGPTFEIDALGRAGDLGACAHYGDPRYYAQTYADRSDDIAFYVRLARQLGGPVLEYGIGNGRVALPIARAGIDVWGVDLSGPMLADLAAQSKLEPAEVRRRLHARRGDLREVRMRKRFPLVIAPFNVFLHLYHRVEVEQFLARVREHLTPRGVFAFDVSLPRPDDLNRDPERRYRAPRFRDPKTGKWTAYTERFEYDPLRQLLLVTMEFTPEKGKPVSVPLTHRQFFPRELEALLHYNGFGELTYTADFTDAPATEDTDSLVVTCRKAAPRRRLAARRART